MIRKFIILLSVVLAVFLLASCEEEHQHIWTESVEIQPTCEGEGVKKFVCVCGEVKKESIPATGHGEIKEVVSIVPGCLTEGENNQVCSVCGKILGTVKVSALGHDIKAEQVRIEPTCTEKGEGVGICQRCGEQLDSWEIPALGHDWGPAIIDKTPTCTETGVAHMVCRRDETHVLNGIINKKPHDFSGEEVITLAPTCTAEGRKEIKCVNCDATTIETIQKVAHQWTPWTNTIVAGEFNEGERYRTCEVCGLVEQETVSATHVHKTLEDAPVEWDEENLIGNNTIGTCVKKAVMYAYCTCYVDDEGNVYEDSGEGRHRLIIGSKELDFDVNNHVHTKDVLESEPGYFGGAVYATMCVDCGTELGKRIESEGARPLDGRWIVTDRIADESQSMDIKYDMSFFTGNVGKVSLTFKMNEIVDGSEVYVGIQDVFESPEYAYIVRRCIDGDWLVDWKTDVTELGVKQIILADNYTIEVESEDVENKTLGINWGMNAVATARQDYDRPYTITIAADNLSTESSFSVEADGTYKITASANTSATLTWVQLEGEAPASYSWLLDGTDTGNNTNTLIVSDISSPHTVQCITNYGTVKMILGVR